MEEADVDCCAMGEDCYCPEGPSAFTEKRHPPDVWNRSKDHFPILSRDGGTLEAGNVRLMHNRCNKVDYKILELEAHLLSLRDEDGQPLNQRAVDSAMETHLRLLAENSGRLPKGRSAYRFASREDRRCTTPFVGLASRRVRRRRCWTDGVHALPMSCVKQQPQLASRASQANLTSPSS